MGIVNETKKAWNDAKDAVSESNHRAQAEGEREKREINGDLMTPGEKVASVVNEAKNNTQAGLDHAKREVRDTV